jgi:hypothetical protein
MGFTEVTVSNVDRIFIYQTPTVWDTKFPDGGVTTTDANQVVSTFAAMPQDGVMSAQINAVAASADGTDYGAWVLTQAVFSRANGVITLVVPAAPAAPLYSGGQGFTWKIALGQVNNNQVVVYVQGSAGKTIKWSVHAAGNYNVVSNVP